LRVTWKFIGAAGAVFVALAVGVTVADPLFAAPRRARTEIPIEIATSGEEVVAGRVLLRLRRHLPRELVRALYDAGVTLEDRLDGGIDVLNVPLGAPPDLVARAFEALDEVEFCEPDGIARTELNINDPQAGYQWHLPKIGVPAAWDVSEGSGNLWIGILDSGVDPTHPDLAGKLAPGWNFIRNNSNTADDFGHGTHVAGIAAAATDNNLGIAGVGFRCSILPVKVLDRSGVGSYAGIAAGIRYASLNGAKVINLSLGGTTPSATLQSAVDAAVARGCIVIASAGNNNSTEPMYPAHCANAIAVGASTAQDARASFSNYGWWVDVAAPGTNLLSTFPLEPMPLGYAPSGYLGMSGTSMAAPVVAGVAGLLASYMGANATPAAIRSILESTCDPVARAWCAAGRIDAGAALARASNPASARVADVRNVAIRIGRYKSGDVTSLFAEDDAGFDLTAEAPRGSRDTEFEIDVAGLSGTVTSLLVETVSRATAHTKQTIGFYNWAAGAFEDLDTGPVGRRVTRRTVDLSMVANSYLRDGLLRMRIHTRSGANFTSSVDFVRVVASGL
jgi:thermitase